MSHKKTGVVAISDSTKNIGERAFANCGELTNVKIPNGVTDIAYAAFSDCKSLSELKLPDSVKSIGDWSFAGCDDLTNINIPNGVTTVDWATFSGCTSLTSITIPDSLTNIGYVAFYGCTDLASITVPDSVTSIGEGAFSGCTGLTNVTIGNSVTSIGDFAFRDCTSLTSVIIPDSVAEIGIYAFEDCTGLTSITIPDSVTSIDYSTFYGCTSLISITIPDSVTSIGDSAFRGCTSLTSITVPDSVTSIGGDAFLDTAYYNNENNWENGVLYIGNHLIKANSEIVKGDCVIRAGTKCIAGSTFSGCTNLTSITIPDSVTRIGANAFSSCTGLTSIIIPDSVISIGWQTFDGCKDLVITTVENSAAHKYAVDNNIKFKLAKSTSINGTDGVSVEGNEISLPETGASLSVKRADSEAEKLQSKLKLYGAEKAVGYDISLQKDGTTVQPYGKVKVNIAVPDGMNGAKCKVLRVEADGSLTDMDAKFENGVLSFETEHFSLYIIAETADDIFADANGDGKIDLDDAILAARAAVGGTQGSSEELVKKADVNGDGKVTIHDALLIARFISGVIDKLPVLKTR